MTRSSPRSEPRNVLAEVELLAREKLGWDGRLARTMRLVEDLQLDSLRNLTLAIEIENHFRIAIGEEEEEGLETVGDLVDLVERQLKAGEVGP